MDKRLQHMKKILIATLIVIMSMAFAGCGDSDNDKTDKDKKTDDKAVSTVELGDYTFYADAWRRVPKKDTESARCYTLTFFFDGNKEPFKLDDSNWKDIPTYDVKLKGKEAITAKSIETREAKKKTGHEGKMVFRYLIPKGEKLPKSGEMTDLKSKESADLDLKDVKLIKKK